MRRQKERLLMRYQDAMYAMIKAIFENEADEGYREYYIHLLKKVLAGKKTTAIAVGLAKLNAKAFVEIFENHNLNNPTPVEGNIKAVNGKYSIYGKDGWYQFLTTSP